MLDFAAPRDVLRWNPDSIPGGRGLAARGSPPAPEPAGSCHVCTPGFPPLFLEPRLARVVYVHAWIDHRHCETWQVHAGGRIEPQSCAASSGRGSQKHRQHEAGGSRTCLQRSQVPSSTLPGIEQPAGRPSRPKSLCHHRAGGHPSPAPVPYTRPGDASARCEDPRSHRRGAGSDRSRAGLGQFRAATNNACDGRAMMLRSTVVDSSTLRPQRIG